MSRGRDLNEALDRALARAGDGAFVVGPNRRVSMWNRAAERILGWTAREVVGRVYCEVLGSCTDHGKGPCHEGCDVAGLWSGEPVEHFEMKARTKAGRPVWLDVSLLEAPKTNGAPPMVVHLFRDITTVRELLERARAQLVSVRPPCREGFGGLTKRELEILRLMASGSNTKMLAERLHVSPATVRNHVQNIFGKLNVHSRLEAVALANRHGLN